MIASSSTVLSNLAYLIGAVVLAGVGGVGVWLRYRQPKSVDAGMASFRRGLSALAPDSAPDRRPAPKSRPAPNGLTHVTHVKVGSGSNTWTRPEAAHDARRSGGSSDDARNDVTNDLTGGQPG